MLRLMPASEKSHTRRDVAGTSNPSGSWPPLAIGFQKPAHLRGDDEFVAGLIPEDGTQSLLREAQAVMGRGVEVADSGVPGCQHGCERLPVRDRPVEVPDARPTEAQFAQFAEFK